MSMDDIQSLQCATEFRGSGIIFGCQKYILLMLEDMSSKPFRSGHKKSPYIIQGLKDDQAFRVYCAAFSVS
jgi:hypothetical protein